MSVLGTSVAAGVAQTTVQAQQVAQAAVRHPKRVHKTAESHQRRLDEDNEAALSDPLPIDNQLANSQKQHQETETDVADGALPPGETPTHTPMPTTTNHDEQPLYRHLDLRA